MGNREIYLKTNETVLHRNIPLIGPQKGIERTIEKQVGIEIALPNRIPSQQNIEHWNHVTGIIGKLTHEAKFLLGQEIEAQNHETAIQLQELPIEGERVMRMATFTPNKKKNGGSITSKGSKMDIDNIQHGYMELTDTGGKLYGATGSMHDLERALTQDERKNLIEVSFANVDLPYTEKVRRGNQHHAKLMIFYTTGNTEYAHQMIKHTPQEVEAINIAVANGYTPIGYRGLPITLSQLEGDRK